MSDVGPALSANTGPLPLEAAAAAVRARIIEVLLAADREVSIDLVNAYAYAVAEMEDAQDRINRTGTVVMRGGKIDANGVRRGGTIAISPYVTVRDNALERMANLAAQLRLQAAMAFVVLKHGPGAINIGPPIPPKKPKPKRAARKRPKPPVA